MRKLVIATALLGGMHAAQAADMPGFSALRGSFQENVNRSGTFWDGWYAGGQFGYTAGKLDLSQSSVALTDYMLRNSVLQEPVRQWSLLDSKAANGLGFGGFVGRNWQWEDAIIGFEVNYANVRSIQNSSSGQMTLLVSPDNTGAPAGHTYTYNTSLSGSASAELKDVLTLRARAGWDAGNFMPYMFGGAAIGRINVSRTATLGVTRYDDYSTTSTQIVGGVPVVVTTPQRDYANVSPVPATRSEGGADSFAPGYTVGFGTEMLLAGGLFARAEYEYVKFVKVKDVAVSTQSARVGIGYKF